MLSFLRKRRSSDDSDISGIVDEPPKSRKPPNTAFRQQRLKAWQPILSPKSVLPFLLLLALIFTPLGIALLYTSYNVEQLTIRYENCDVIANTTSFKTIPTKYVGKHFRSFVRQEWTQPSWKLAEDNGELICQLKFEIPHNIKGPIYMYYKLTKFYQNHREFVESFDLDQIRGKAVKAEDLDSDCKPLKTDPEGKPYYPCGLISNSLFNDTFSVPYSSTDKSDKFEMTNKEISWSADRSRFKMTQYDPSDISPPPNWRKRYPNGYTSENLPDLSTWEELQVWMRTAGLPNFMKLALRNETGTLSKGEYIIDIGMNYPVSIFGGSKSVVLTTSSVIGGRNLSLGIAYLVVASLSMLFAILFLVKYLIQPRKLGDHSYLSFGERNETTIGDGFSRQEDSILNTRGSTENRSAVREIL